MIDKRIGKIAGKRSGENINKHTDTGGSIGKHTDADGSIGKRNGRNIGEHTGGSAGIHTGISIGKHPGISIGKRMGAFDFIFSVVNSFILLLVCIAIIYPLYYMLIVSFSNGNAVLRGEVNLVPVGFTMKAYETVLQNPMIISSYGNTIKYTFLGTLVNLIMSVLCAFPLSRKYFYGRSFFSMFIVFTILFDAGIVSNFLVVQRLGLLDTMWALVLPPAISAYNMIIIRTFFQQLPEEMYESAYIDGATDYTALLRIALPLSKPVLATMVLFYAVGHWNSFLPALLYLGKRELYPMQLVMRNIVISDQTDTFMVALGVLAGDTNIISKNLKYAVTFITILPILAFYPFIQKYFARGVMIGALKG